jgi:hypothetical protein
MSFHVKQALRRELEMVSVWKDGHGTNFFIGSSPVRENSANIATLRILLSSSTMPKATQPELKKVVLPIPFISYTMLTSPVLGQTSLCPA